MAKRSTTKGDKPEAGSKGVSRKTVEALIERHFAAKGRIDRIMVKAKKDAAGPRADLGVILDDAERLGISRQAIKKVFKRIELRMKADEARDAAETDVQDAIDHLEDMIEAQVKPWDETPLGKAMATGVPRDDKDSEKGGKPEGESKTSATVVDLAKKAGATTPGATS